MTMHFYLFYISNGVTLFETLQPLRDGLNILPSFQAQLPNFHYSSPLSSLLLPGNSDTYVAGPSRYNCVLGQDRIWWGLGWYRHNTEPSGGDGWCIYLAHFGQSCIFQPAEEGYKKEEREGIKGQTMMSTPADYYIRRFVSVWVKWPANMVLLGWKFKSA